MTSGEAVLYYALVDKKTTLAAPAHSTGANPACQPGQSGPGPAIVPGVPNAPGALPFCEIGLRLEGLDADMIGGREMKKIINLTQHNATPEQIAQGVVEPSPFMKERVRELLTFDEPPDPAEIIRRAEEFAALAYEIVTAEYDAETVTVMVGGAPFFISALERELMFRGMDPVYAFSMRESIDQAQEDGSVRKVAVFRHLGFVRPPRHEDFEAYTIRKFSREEAS